MSILLYVSPSFNTNRAEIALNEDAAPFLLAFWEYGISSVNDRVMLVGASP
jgi:hypothetical protein